MDMRRLGLIVLALSLFGVLDGFVLGLAGGLFYQTFHVDAEIQSRQKDDYVLMVSAAYVLDGNLAHAKQRLSFVHADPSTREKYLSDLARAARQRDDVRSANALLALAVALDSDAEAAQLSANHPTPVPTFTATATPTSRPVALATETTATPAASSAATRTPTPTRVVRVPTSTPLSSTKTAFLPIGALSLPIDASLSSIGPAPLPSTTSHLTTSVALLPTSAAQPSTATTTPQTPTATVTRASGQAAYALKATPTANVDYKLTSVRQLTPCENGGNHHLFVLVLDKQGNGIPNVPIEFSWAGGSKRDVTGKKVENIPALGINAKTTAGYVNYPMFKGSYRVRVYGASSEQTDWLTVDIPQSQLCAKSDNPIGNSLYHYSYLIVFQKTR